MKKEKAKNEAALIENSKSMLGRTDGLEYSGGVDDSVLDPSNPTALKTTTMINTMRNTVGDDRRSAINLNG